MLNFPKESVSLEAAHLSLWYNFFNWSVIHMLISTKINQQKNATKQGHRMTVSIQDWRGLPYCIAFPMLIFPSAVGARLSITYGATRDDSHAAAPFLSSASQSSALGNSMTNDPPCTETCERRLRSSDICSQKGVSKIEIRNLVMACIFWRILQSWIQSSCLTGLPGGLT